MYVKIDDTKLKEHYFNLFSETRKYTGHCDSLSYLYRKMDTIKETLDLLGLEAEWLKELNE